MVGLTTTFIYAPLGIAWLAGRLSEIGIPIYENLAKMGEVTVKSLGLPTREAVQTWQQKPIGEKLGIPTAEQVLDRIIPKVEMPKLPDVSETLSNLTKGFQLPQMQLPQFRFQMPEISIPQALPQIPMIPQISLEMPRVQMPEGLDMGMMLPLILGLGIVAIALVIK